jgi:hypothetical protein
MLAECEGLYLALQLCPFACPICFWTWCLERGLEHLYWPAQECAKIPYRDILLVAKAQNLVVLSNMSSQFPSVVVDGSRTGPGEKLITMNVLFFSNRSLTGSWVCHKDDNNAYRRHDVVEVRNRKEELRRKLELSVLASLPRASRRRRSDDHTFFRDQRGGCFFVEV